MNFTGNIIERGVKRITIELNERKDIPFAPEDLLDIEISKHREQKSPEANSYLWVQCEKVAKALSTKGSVVTKEEVYKKYIREVGQFEIVPIKNTDVDKFIDRWSRLGLGWFSEIVGKSKLPGYTNIMRYYGSSCYDSKELSRVIDDIVTDCHEIGVETKRPEEIKSMMEAWK